MNIDPVIYHQASVDVEIFTSRTKPSFDDFQVTSYLTQNIDQCDVALTKKAKKRKNL